MLSCGPAVAHKWHLVYTFSENSPWEVGTGGIYENTLEVSLE